MGYYRTWIEEEVRHGFLVHKQKIYDKEYDNNKTRDIAPAGAISNTQHTTYNIQHAT